MCKNGSVTDLLVLSFHEICKKSDEKTIVCFPASCNVLRRKCTGPHEHERNFFVKYEEYSLV